jgi:hypothetical protein
MKSREGVVMLSFHEMMRQKEKINANNDVDL